MGVLEGEGAGLVQRGGVCSEPALPSSSTATRGRRGEPARGERQRYEPGARRQPALSKPAQSRRPIDVDLSQPPRAKEGERSLIGRVNEDLPSRPPVGVNLTGECGEKVPAAEIQVENG